MNCADAASVLAAAALVQVATVHPAAAADAAVTGLEIWSASSTNDPLSQTETAEAFCPTSKRVIGGGGGVEWFLNDYTHDVVLTRMQPVHPFTGADSFVVTGERINGGTDTDWSVKAYAVCADPLPGLHIVTAASTPSSASSQLAQATCPDEEVVVGTGAYIYANSSGQVGLQVMRASMTGKVVYAQGHEDADGYASSWFVMAVAVCADMIDGYAVRNVPSDGDDSESSKAAEATCLDGRIPFGGGGAVAFTAPGATSLRWVALDDVLDEVHVSAIENTPTSTDWDYIVAQVICGF
ncbi:hypothetical protein [Couchioplanes caeruleus]|uniref:Uncharacterized protein n=1 Tax=Couchioplanes caeruleus subsp. caeruleus TaxID=56427 RepID=A0A1K0FPL9_9ACTN|nr:hypothetical protein [Couchioplanes caeruleus]OJF14791.1 hypothetical protein BG844_07920 [Couchioplanes caeruleus subsp. caeruleus]